MHKKRNKIVPKFQPLSGHSFTLSAKHHHLCIFISPFTFSFQQILIYFIAFRISYLQPCISSLSFIVFYSYSFLINQSQFPDYVLFLSFWHCFIHFFLSLFEHFVIILLSIIHFNNCHYSWSSNIPTLLSLYKSTLLPMSSSLNPNFCILFVSLSSVSSKFPQSFPLLFFLPYHIRCTLGFYHNTHFTSQTHEPQLLKLP